MCVDFRLIDGVLQPLCGCIAPMREHTSEMRVRGLPTWAAGRGGGIESIGVSGVAAWSYGATGSAYVAF